MQTNDTAVARSHLNSDRIRARFGSCGIEILEQRDDMRSVSLFSSDDTMQTCRTYALAKFPPDIPEELACVHGTILAGKSIGLAFRDANLGIVKRSLQVGSFRIDSELHVLSRLMRLAPGTIVGVHVYRLELPQVGGKLAYATIAEAHHPDYLSFEDLEVLYTGKADNSDTAVAAELLDAIKAG